MENINVMVPDKNYSYNEVLQGLLSNDSNFIEYIKSTDFKEEDLAGLKLFLENNHYDLVALKNFTEIKPLAIHITKTTPFVIHKIAATFFVLIGLGVLINYNNHKNKAIENYLIKDQGFKVLMGSNKANLEVSNGMNYYRNKSFKEALQYFSLLPMNDTAMYYSGICEIELGNWESAKNIFSKIPVSSIYKEKSNFYAAICLLHNKQNKEALQLLQSSIFTDSLFSMKKNEILKDLEK